MEIKCNNYETKEIIKFMRDFTEKTQTSFANDVNKKRNWCAKLEAGKSNITLDAFIKLANINNLEIIIRERK